MSKVNQIAKIDNVPELPNQISPNYNKTHWFNDQTPLNASNLNHIEEGISGNTQSINSNMINISENHNLIDDTRDKLNETIDQVNKNSTDIDINKTAIEKNKQDIATNKQNIETNKQNIATNKSNIEKNAKAIEDNHKEFLKHKSDYENPHNVTAHQVDAYTQTEVDSKDTALQNQITTNKNNITKNTNTLNVLNSDINTVGSIKHTAQALIDAEFNEFITTTGNANVVDTFKDLIDYAATHTHDDDSYTSLVAQVQQNTNSINSNRSSINTNRTNISTNTSDIADLKEQLQNLNGNIEDLTNVDLTGLQNQVNTNKTNISTNTANITKHTSNINALNTTVDSIKSNGGYVGKRFREPGNNPFDASGNIFGVQNDRYIDINRYTKDSDDYNNALYTNMALGQASTAKGAGNIAFGLGASASGYNTVAIGMGAHAEGSGTTKFERLDISHNKDLEGNTAHAQINMNTYILECASHTKDTSGTECLPSTNAEIYHSAIVNNRTQFKDPPTGVLDKIVFVANQLNFLQDGSTYVDHNNTNLFKGYGYHAALGFVSHVEGGNNLAFGTASHSEGHYNMSQGLVSHTEGGLNDACASYTHAEGLYNRINTGGKGSHLEGITNRLNGIASHGEGFGNTIEGDYSHGEGFGNTINKQYSFGGDYTGLFTGDLTTKTVSELAAAGIDTSSKALNGTIMVVYQDTSDDTDKGKTYKFNGNTKKFELWYGSADGYKNYMSYGCHNEGYENIAEFLAAHAEGYGTYAGRLSHAEGDHSTTRGGVACHAEGVNCVVNSYASHVEGKDNTVSGRHAHGEGNANSTYADNSHIEGAGNYIYSYATYSHVGGRDNTAKGENHFIHGRGILTTGYDVSAIGTVVKAEGANTRHGYVKADGTTSDVFVVGNGSYEMNDDGTLKRAFSKVVDPNDGGYNKEYHILLDNEYITQFEQTGTVKPNYDYDGDSNSDGSYIKTVDYGYIHIDNLKGFKSGVIRFKDDGINYVFGELVNPTGNYRWGSIGITSTAFRVTMDGDIHVQNKVNASGADYAEYYEWADGNPNNEDRRGRFVTFDDEEKLRIATDTDDYILGIVSSCPAVVGNSFSQEWQGKYLTDLYGQRLTEKYTTAEEIITDEITGEETIIESKEGIRYVINPEYDDSKKYVPREHRPEWSPVGTHGRLIVIDDGSCKVNKYCTVTGYGIATYSESKTDYRVVARIDDTHVKVVLK